MHTIYLIKNLNEDSWWNYQQGWILNISDATVYSEDEYEDIRLPMEGVPIKFTSN